MYFHAAAEPVVQQSCMGPWYSNRHKAMTGKGTQEAAHSSEHIVTLGRQKHKAQSTKQALSVPKLDGVCLVDNRPFTN